MSLLWNAIWWTLESQVWVPKEHSRGLKICANQGNSLSAKIILKWAPLMCFPQWIFGFAFAVGQRRPEAAAIFAARFLAMCIVRKLDAHIPYTRALGLCHLLTFGPVYAWLWTSSRTFSTLSHINPSTSTWFEWFLWSQKYVIGICLTFDARDFLFHMAGYPYPCYVREGIRAGALKIEKDDPRANASVDWRSYILGP